MPEEADRQRALAGILAAESGTPVEVVALDRLSGGASAQMWSVSLADGRSLVLRCTRAGDAGMSIGATAEAAVLGAVADRVKVPTVVAAFAGDPVFGDGYVMERLDGETVPRRILREDRYAGTRARLVQDSAQALAAIHECAPSGIEGLPVLGVADQLDLLEGLHRSQGQAVPVFEVALRWLRDRAVDRGGRALVHGDFRIGNLLVDEDGLVAVLDWELAHLGDPLEDLGWLCAPSWRFGGPGEVGGFGSREELYTAYGRATGTEVDPDRVRFWEVLATLKWGVICQFQAARHLGGQRSVELAAIGRRVTETELDLLLLLDEEA